MIFDPAFQRLTLQKLTEAAQAVVDQPDAKLEALAWLDCVYEVFRGQFAPGGHEGTEPGMRTMVRAEVARVVDELASLTPQPPAATVARTVAQPPSEVATSILVGVGESLASVERRVILATLAKFNDSKEPTAAALGVSLKTLYNRLKEYRETDGGVDAPAAA